MELETIPTPDSQERVVLAASGALNAVSAPTFRAHLNAIVSEGRSELVVDLSGVSFMDSSGLAALVSGLKTARSTGGTLKLAGPQAQARLVFELTLMDQVFQIYESVEAALNSFAR
jgi:anti-sigma B factor antagonist